MGLTKHYIDIKDVKFADRDYIQDHVLYINKEAMIAKINNKLYKSLELELAFPGEKVRIATPGDIIQPMLKLDDEQGTFPGIFGDIRRAGTGRSLMLRGVVVTESYETTTGNAVFIDMYGEAAEHTIFSKLIHLCIVAVPNDGVELLTYLDALKKSSLTMATYLASLAKELVPDEIKEWSAPKGDYRDAEGKPLPKIAYVMYDMHLKPTMTAKLYGHDALEAFPTILEPYEILDGALVTANHEQIVNSSPTYSYQNQPIIEQLIDRHGKDLNFVGLVVASVHFAMNNKKRNAMIACNLCKNTLDADIVLIDPAVKRKITHDLLHENCDYTPYEGISVTGYPVLTISRGEIIVQDGEFVGEKGRGKFVKRKLPNLMK